ncbi:uncharacterized protein MELLADRAFT_104401 [Melampsora larici-populina 98AG31]|uniref:Uncharacterized protein n=1 Tax=Melampsora larici-populina (strain 98AG31 / pathotype 3-4-7) TaxID=747676 RepID=F4REJ9_MELLP|nr:uncharacterized protein MELLADRAFT_104401 [Melampsora larici-populina 98AG31]EGG09262.1 hypothetical protein MELLADRAFT_104401 [Melampsora larici-populina 98AG31]
MVHGLRSANNYIQSMYKWIDMNKQPNCGEMTAQLSEAKGTEWKRWERRMKKADKGLKSGRMPSDSDRLGLLELQIKQGTAPRSSFLNQSLHGWTLGRPASQLKHLSVWPL